MNQQKLIALAVAAIAVGFILPLVDEQAAKAIPTAYAGSVAGIPSTATTTDKVKRAAITGAVVLGTFYLVAQAMDAVNLNAPKVS